MTRLFPKRELLILIVLAFVGLVLLPGLNAFLPANHPLHISTFTLSVYGKYLCYAVLAMGVNLLWGYTGLLSLGQCLFFALGGYCLGMYLMLLIGRLGQYRTELPDFMVFLEFPARFPTTGGLPPHWIPFHNFWFALIAILWVPALVSLIFGFLAFRSRIKGVYFSILSQALTYAACLMFFRNDFTFGGNNGLTDFKYLLGSPALTTNEIPDAASLVARLKTGSDPVSKFIWNQVATTNQTRLADAKEITAGLKDGLVNDLNIILATQAIFDEQRFAGIALSAGTRELIARNPRDAGLQQLNRQLLEAVYPREISPKGFMGYVVNSPATKRALYMCSGMLVLLVYVFCRWLTSTKFGLIQRAIRDSENRVLFSGYATANFKLFVFVTAAIISGLGGALFVPQVGIINPSEMAPDKSLEAVVWVAVGGRGNMLGPILGAVSINALKSFATHAFAEQWPYILGSLFVFVTVCMPKGIIGLPEQLRGIWRKFFTTPPPEDPVPLTKEKTSPVDSKGELVNSE